MSMLIFLCFLVNFSEGSTRVNYTAAVVEYATPFTPTLSANEVMLYNAQNYVEFMTNASQSQVDIIVFPESGLFRNNARIPVEVSSPEDNIAPCDRNDTFHPALVLISCASRSLGIYTVINLQEVYRNLSSNETEHFNTNVAFDRNGKIVGRYRKYNPYGELVNKTATPEHSYFTTDFGVTFGMFICFDIDFQEPALILARNYNITHFVFSNCWQSELPFLTATQTQWSWAFSLNVVLLASGCNDPAAGGSGSGIYLGKHGSLVSYQSNVHSSRMLITEVPILTNYTDGFGKYSSSTYKEVASQAFQVSNSSEGNISLAMLRDYLEVYKTLPLLESADLVEFNNSSSLDSSINVTITSTATLCDNHFCCDFQITMMNTFSKTPPSPESTRRDDFSLNLYRYAVFDGVRSYGGGLATGGVQVCAVIPCLNSTLESCGLPSNSNASVVSGSSLSNENVNYYKIATTFQSISIAANFFYNNTFVFPDVFVTGKEDQFGSLLTQKEISFEKLAPFNNSIICTLKTTTNISNLITAGLYARQFDRDGQVRTEVSNITSCFNKGSYLFVLFAILVNLVHNF